MEQQQVEEVKISQSFWSKPARKMMNPLNSAAKYSIAAEKDPQRRAVLKRLFKTAQIAEEELKARGSIISIRGSESKSSTFVLGLPKEKVKQEGLDG